MSILKANIRKALPNKFEEIRQNLFLPEYNVKHFGANGDGVTDDTEEVQAAIDAAEASGGGRVIFPAGIYPINVTVETSGVDLVGQSFTSTWLIPHDTTQPIVTVGNLGDTASDRIDDIHIVGLQFTDNNTNIYAQNTDTTLLFLHNVGNNSVIANCRFSGSLGYGILAEGFQDSVIQNCTFISLGQNAPARYGIYITSIDGGAGYMSPNNIRFEHCTFHGDQGNSFIYMEDVVGGLPPRDFYFTDCKWHPSVANGNPYIEVHGGSRFHFSNCFFGSGRVMTFIDSSVIFLVNVFSTNNVVNNNHIFDFQDCNRVFITNSHLYSSEWGTFQPLHFDFECTLCNVVNIGYSGTSKNNAINDESIDGVVFLDTQYDRPGSSGTEITLANPIDTTEILNEITFDTHVNWDVTNDFDDSGGNAEYIFTANQTSILQQTAANRADSGTNSAFYMLTYTITVTTVPDGDFALTLENFPNASTALPFTAGTHTVYFQAAANATTQPFTIQAICTTATQGQFTIDNISARSILNPKILFNTKGIDRFAIGVDMNDNDLLKIASGSALGLFDAIMIDSSQNVGIKRTPTLSGLDVDNNIAGQILYCRQRLALLNAINDWINNSDDSQIYSSLNTGIEYPFNLNGCLIIQPRSSAAMDIILATGTPTPSPRIIIDGNNGNVGIGSAQNPPEKVTVGQANDTDANVVDIYDGGHDKPGMIALRSNDGTADNVYYLWVDSSGRVRINTAKPTDQDVDGTVVGTQT